MGIKYFGTEAIYPGSINGVAKDYGKSLTGLNELCGCDAAANLLRNKKDDGTKNIFIHILQVV